MLYRFLLILSVLGVIALSAPQGVEAQDTMSGWMTIAGGDEIICLAVDPQDPGLLWAGTEGGGVVMWDIYSSPAVVVDQFLFPNEPGLRSNTINDIAFGPDETWLATSAGVTRATTAGDWVTYDTYDGLPALEITAVAVDAYGTVWAGTHSAGIAALPVGATSWVVYTADEAQPENGPGSDEIADIAADIGNTDNVVVAHGRSDASVRPALSVYDPATDEWQTIDSVGPGGDPTLGPAGDQIMALDFDETTGELWMGSWAEGVLYSDDTTWDQYELADGVCGKSVWAIAAYDGEVWAACGDDSSGDGASRFVGGSWETWGADELPTGVVTSIAMADGVTYLGTNGPGDGGSGIVPFDGDLLDPITTGPERPWSNDILAMYFDDYGALWVGTRGSGLMRYYGEWEQFTVENTDGLLVGDTVTDLAVRRGKLWIAATKTVPSGTSLSDGGVSVIDTDTLVWDEPIQQMGGSDCLGLPDNEVSSVAIGGDENETVWLGIGIGSGMPGYSSASHQGEGVVAYDPVDDYWSCYTYEDTGDGVGLAGNTVLDLAAEGDELWVAASYHTSVSDGRRRGGGVSRYLNDLWTMWGDGDAGLVTYATRDLGADRDPISGDVRSIMVDGDGVPWAGTWDLQTGDLTSIWPFVDVVVNRYDDDYWLADVFEGSGWASALAEDGRGYVWVGTTRGHIQEYSPAGGLPEDTATGGALIWDRGDWTQIVPPESAASGLEPSGLAARAITSIAIEPSTGNVWLGTENGGFSVYLLQAPVATATYDPGSGTAAPTDTPGSGGPPIATIPPTATQPHTVVSATPEPQPTATEEEDDDEPEPPPDIPEAGTIVLLGAGLAGLAAWATARRRRS